MAVYNEFPVKGQLIDGDLVYLGIHEAKQNSVSSNTFRYVTYESKKNRIYAHGGNVDSTGKLTFNDSNNPELIIWTYQKGPNSTASFYTTINGKTKWLYTDGVENVSWNTSYLSDTKMFYNTQGLPDLWAGYFGYLGVENSKSLSVLINSIDFSSNFLVVIPTKLYDKNNNCTSIDNSQGQGLSLQIESYKKNSPNSNIYWSSENSCKSSIPINYCQNQSIIYTNIDYDRGKPFNDNKPLYCGDTLENVTDSCMGSCESFNGQNNTPLCYPGTVDETLFGCTSYNPNINIYNTSEQENNNGGTGGNGENGGKEDSDEGSSSWWIILLIVGAVLIVLIIIIVIIVVLVKKSKKKESTPIPTQPVPYLPQPVPYLPQPVPYLPQPVPNPYQPLYPSYNQPVINSPYQAIQPLP